MFTYHGVIAIHYDVGFLNGLSSRYFKFNLECTLYVYIDRIATVTLKNSIPKKKT